MSDAIGCPHRGKWFGRGCKFQPRYDTRSGALSEEQIEALGEACFASDMPRVIASICNINATYIRDVCIKCGRTAERSGSSGNVTRLDLRGAYGNHDGRPAA